MKRKKNNLINWIKSKNNYPFIFFSVLGLTIGTYEYSFVATIIGFLIVIIIGIVGGYIINKMM